MNQLMKAMLERKVLTSDTVITANYIVRDCTGRYIHKQDDFMMIDVKQQNNEYKLTLQHLLGAQAVSVWARDIIALDGMKPERFVEVYNINPDGTNKLMGKKRGRKSKIRCEFFS